MVLTVLCWKLTGPTKSVTSYTTLCGEPIALEEPMTVFISLSGMASPHAELLRHLRNSWGH